jgi:hypothetical protein
MAMLRQGLSITITATNDLVDLGDLVEIVGLTFQGTGLTAAQRLVLRDGSAVGAGSLLADYVVEAATDNADLWTGREPRIVRYLAVDNTTVDGTWVLTVFIRR